MRVSREQVAENRRRILDAAGRLFRERGFESVSVAEVMNAAGMTHGGFYGHFRSKDDLIAQTLAHVLVNTSLDAPDLAGYAARYLAPGHRDDRAGGCATAGLAGEALRQTPEARAAMTAALRHQIARFSATARGETDAARRRAAIGAWSAMVGSLLLSRLSDDPALSDEVLAETRAWIAETAAAEPGPRAD